MQAAAGMRPARADATVAASPLTLLLLFLRVQGRVRTKLIKRAARIMIEKYFAK